MEGQLEGGREAYASRAWRDAHELLAAADHASALGAADLERLATAAYMAGDHDDYLGALERAHQAHLAAGEPARAVRCAAWLVFELVIRGEVGRASGWRARARRLLEREARDCVEHGYMLVPAMLQEVAAGDYDAGYATATEAAAIGERFAEPDLVALAVHEQGLALIGQGRIAEGLGLLDEVMVAVTAGELSPIVTGLLYCSVIEGCQVAYALPRAREWTAALSRWCAEQPDMVAFTGRCLVHRAEIMQLRGAWHDALLEARRAARREGMSRAGAGLALYRQGELHRLRGHLDAAEAAYRGASAAGCEPQPGFALLRLAQGRRDAAAAAIRRALAETGDRLRRAQLLPAFAEIMLAAGDVAAARSACGELEALAAPYDSSVLDATVEQARGALELAEGDARAALVALRRAWRVWHELDAPYEAARVRVGVAAACRALGDADTAALELEAARALFARLGAAPDVARVDALTGRAASAHGLTPRELQVLRLLAAGESNKAIAAELVLSARTVERHVSNILAKVGASSRAAATAYAYEHQLV